MFSFITAICKKTEVEKKVMEDDLKLAEKEMVDRIKKHEGLRLKPYHCPAGKLTIGYGRNIEDNGISQSTADQMLAEDVAQCTKELFENYPWTKDLSPRRRCVLIEMVFNMGIARFKQFKNMLWACQTGDFEKASMEALNSNWHKQVGKRAETLAKVLMEG